MSTIAPDIEAFLRDHLIRQREASPHTCDSYARSFQLLFEFAAHTLEVSPSQLTLEQLDMPLIATFLEHLEQVRGNWTCRGLVDTSDRARMLNRGEIWLGKDVRLRRSTRPR